MTGGPPDGAAFDSHVDDYDAQCMRGLSVSGEGRDYFARGRVAHLRRWWESAGLPAPARVLDYGCGLGDTLGLLADAFPGAAVQGLDPSPGLIARARERHPGRLLDVLLPGAPGDPQDLVHLNGVVHHVTSDERPALFTDLAARLAPGGVVALFENNPLNPGTRWVMSRIPFDRDAEPLTAGESRRLLRGAGLEPLHSASLFWFPRSLRWLRSLERALEPIPLGAQYGVFARRPR